MSSRLKIILPALLLCAQSFVALAENAYLDIYENWTVPLGRQSEQKSISYWAPLSTWPYRGINSATPNGHFVLVLGMTLGTGIPECARAYVDPNFSGTEIPIAAEDSYYDLHYWGFGDRISSFRVTPGCYLELFADPGFQNSVQKSFVGSVPQVDSNDTVSSMRCTCNADSLGAIVH